MKELIYEIPGKMQGHYYPEEKTIVDTWTVLNATMEEWKETIHDVGVMDLASKKGVTTWITDTSNATGVFGKQIQQFRKDVSAEATAKNGVKLFLTVMPASPTSALSARKNVKAYEGYDQMRSVSVLSLKEALDIREKELLNIKAEV